MVGSVESPVRVAAWSGRCLCSDQALFWEVTAKSIEIDFCGEWFGVIGGFDQAIVLRLCIRPQCGAAVVVLDRSPPPPLIPHHRPRCLTVT